MPTAFGWLVPNDAGANTLAFARWPENGEGGLHFGVVAMRQLALQAGGQFIIDDNDDQGVIVRATFPVADGARL